MIATGNHIDFDSLRGAPRSLRMTTLLQHLDKLQFKELLWSRGPKDAGFASGFVTNCQRRLAADKLQFEQQKGKGAVLPHPFM